jgi:flagellar hook-associated protein 3 FlgL
MASVNNIITRTSTQQKSFMMLDSLRRNSVEMLKIQEELSTGLRVNRPSDDPGAIGGIIAFRKSIEQYDLRLRNLNEASNMIDATDQALDDINLNLFDAKQIAMQNVGTGADEDARLNAVEVVDGLLTSMRNIANRKYLDVHLFAGQDSGQAPFAVHRTGGLQYLGAREDLVTDLGLLTPIGVNTNGDESLGALSSRVTGRRDLDPAASAATRLAELRGATDQGVTLGEVKIEVFDGVATSTATVDLSDAETMGDVALAMTDAIQTLDPAGSLAVTSTGFDLTAGAGFTVTVRDLASGTTARDLGLRNLSAAGATVSGGDVNPKLTMLTTLGDLQPAPDLTGFSLTNGAFTETISLNATMTIEDLANAIRATDLGVRLEINSSGTGLNVINELSGVRMGIAEAGGTSATDLGIRSFDTTTAVTDLNYGLGVRANEAGQSDFRVTLRDGSSFEVDLDSEQTIQDVLDTINSAAAAAGLGGVFNATLTANGNGLELVDTTGGGGDLYVTRLHSSDAVADLGIEKRLTDPSPANLVGDDVAMIQTESVFTHLTMLREALVGNDSRGITEAGARIEEDLARVATAHAGIGVRSQRVAQAKVQTEELKLQAKQLLSNLQDADYAESITRMTQLEQQLQANLSVGANLLRLSLLDFLR